MYESDSELRQELLEKALWYATEFHVDVLPLEVGGVILSGVRLSDASRRRSTITNWFANPKVTGVGLLTGKDLLVMDCEYGEIPEEIPKGSTLITVKTPSGGLHVYFSNYEFPIPSVESLFYGVNLIGEGAYVIAPPTKGYEFKSNKGPLPLEVPGEIVNLIDERSRRPAPPLMGATIPEAQYIVQDLIPKGDIGIWVGAPKFGKTTVLTSLAVAVSEGKAWMGLRTQKTPVVIFDRENCQRVARDMCARQGLTSDENFHFYGRWYQGGALELPDIGKLPIMGECPLMIFDSFTRFHKGSENSADDVRDTFEHFRSLADRGATVIIIHHTPKGDEDTFRGSSGIEAATDHMYVIKGEKSEGYLHTIKLTNRHFRTKCLQHLELKVNDQGALEPEQVSSGGDMFLDALKANPSGLTISELQEKSGSSRRAFEAWRKKNGSLIQERKTGKATKIVLVQDQAIDSKRLM